MEITSRMARQIGLLSMILVIIPMVIFPSRFGAALVKASLINVAYELLFYGVVVYLFNRRATLVQLVQLAGVCLIYRLVLGAVFGLTLTVMYSMTLSVSLAMGMSGYLPVILLHVGAAPFVLRPALRQLFDVQPTSPVHSEELTVEPADAGRTSIAVSKERGFSKGSAVPSTEVEVKPEPTALTDTMPEISISEGNGFERATRYIGEDASVQLAAVVDPEGLLLGYFQRGDIEAEDWAPYSLLLREANRQVVGRVGWGDPERIKIQLPDRTMVVAFSESFCLTVVAERKKDDFLNIRINQGMEIIRKYIAQRYSQKLFENVERTHVRSA